jgi:hypothetical protein
MFSRALARLSEGAYEWNIRWENTGRTRRCQWRRIALKHFSTKWKVDARKAMGIVEIWKYVSQQTKPRSDHEVPYI